MQKYVLFYICLKRGLYIFPIQFKNFSRYIFKLFQLQTLEMKTKQMFQFTFINGVIYYCYVKVFYMLEQEKIKYNKTLGFGPRTKY